MRRLFTFFILGFVHQVAVAVQPDSFNEVHQKNFLVAGMAFLKVYAEMAVSQYDSEDSFIKKATDWITQLGRINFDLENFGDYYVQSVFNQPAIAYYLRTIDRALEGVDETNWEDVQAQVVNSASWVVESVDSIWMSQE